MRKKRFSLAQLLLAIALTAAAVLGCGLLAVRAWMGEGGRSLVEGLRLVNTLFVGEYDETEVVDAALEGMVSRLGDRWSYYLTAEELEAQNQRRTNQYVGVGITVNYTREEGLYILGVCIIPDVRDASLVNDRVASIHDLRSDVNALFAEYFRQRKGQEPNEEIRSLFREALSMDGDSRKSDS